jgi:hypothetical protein
MKIFPLFIKYEEKASRFFEEGLHQKNGVHFANVLYNNGQKSVRKRLISMVSFIVVLKSAMLH